MKTDVVNHPPHYTAHPSGVECIEITERLGFCIGNAVKYIWRAELKDIQKTIEDLEKSLWYMCREHTKRKAFDDGLELDVYIPADTKAKMAKVLNTEVKTNKVKAEILSHLFNASLHATNTTDIILAECLIKTMIKKMKGN